MKVQVREKKAKGETIAFDDLKDLLDEDDSSAGGEPCPAENGCHHNRTRIWQQGKFLMVSFFTDYGNGQ